MLAVVAVQSKGPTQICLHQMVAGVQGGGGGAYGDWNNRNPVGICSFTYVGDGSPENTRSGFWALKGNPYGSADLLVTFESDANILSCSAGGAGNGYSPSPSERNDGGNGGGAIFLEATEVIVTGNINARGQQGRPRPDESMYNTWRTTNTQDGSGGAGAGGGVLIIATSSQGGSIRANAIDVRGGTCGANTGWNGEAGQRGGAGAYGRVSFVIAQANNGASFNNNQNGVTVFSGKTLESN
eukprot:UC4_evm1s1208